jgi:hypothetical protein
MIKKKFYLIYRAATSFWKAQRRWRRRPTPTFSPSTPIAIRNEKRQRPNDPTEVLDPTKESDPTEKIRDPTEKSMAAPQNPPNNGDRQVCLSVAKHHLFIF